MEACDVLIVDDDTSVRDSLRFVLTEVVGLSVQEAASGREGLARLSQVHPRVVLLDVEMPYLGGQAVLDAMRAKPDLSSIPVVLMSGREDMPQPALQKPFSLNGLVEALNAYFPGLRPH